MARSINHGPILDQFYADLVGWRIKGVVPQAARVEDVHRCYIAWAQRNERPFVGNVAWFARHLSSRRLVMAARKRYADGAFIVGPCAIFFLDGPVRTRHGNAQDVIGRQVCEFRSQVDRYVEQCGVLQPLPEPVQ